MHITCQLLVAAWAAFAPLSFAQGTGPYSAVSKHSHAADSSNSSTVQSWREDAGLPKHTIYMPNSPPANMPVVLWGNGQCYGDGLAYEGFLTEVASHGIMVIANGWVTGSDPKYQGDITKDLSYLTNAISWIQRVAGSGSYANVNADQIAMAGHSCGGWQTIQMRTDSRVKMLAPFGWGPDTPSMATQINVPVAFFVGSLDTSIALPQVSSAWSSIPSPTRAWWGTYPGLGHDGTFAQPNGGVWAKTFAQWILYSLSQNSDAARYFTNGGAEADGWSVQKKSM